MATRLWVTPLQDRVVVARAELEEATEEMFALPGESAKEKPQVATVLAVGPGRRAQLTGELIPVALEVGQQVLHGMYAGTEITVDGKTFLILREDECMGVLQREEVPDTEAPRLELAKGQEGNDSPFGRSVLEMEEDRTCIDESHAPPAALVPATHIAIGPHGRLPYCEEHALAYQKVMEVLGTPVEIVPIEQPATSTE